MWVAGTQDGIVNKRSTGRPSEARRMKSNPARPSTFTISWGSLTVAPVPCGTTASAKPSGVSMEDSTWMCGSVKAGAR